MTEPLSLILSTAGSAGLLILAYMTVWFVVALVIRRNDIVDIAWGLGFVAVAVWLFARTGAPLTLRQYVVTALVTVWGLRLAGHIGARNLKPGKGEDARYAAWRLEWGKWLVPRAYLQIFLLQGLFMLLILAPVIAAGSVAGPSTLGPLDFLGLAVWLFGYFFEAVGDAQLASFLSESANRGHIMDRGLWSWTRHPNYFGESVMWWGIAIIALSVPGGWIGLLSPVVITWLLLKVSGVPMLEKHFEGRPGWDAYKARTSAFVPLPPKGRRG